MTFRDHTKRTEERAQRIYQAIAKSGNDAAASSSPSGELVLARQGSPNRATFGPPPDFLNLSFFKNAYIIGSVNAYLGQWNRDCIEFLEGNLKHGGRLYPTCADPLKAAIETLSLWNLSLTNEGAQADVQYSVMELYGKTLRQIAKALGDPSGYDMDQICLAIEYMLFFEASVSLTEVPVLTLQTLAQPGANLASTAEHIRGLIAVISHRGPDQFVNETGRRLCLDALLLFVSSSLVLSHSRLTIDRSVDPSCTRNQ